MQSRIHPATDIPFWQLRRLPAMCHLARLRRLLVLAMLILAMAPAAQAHLMVAQRGTLNLVGDGAFMVLSLPVSAFSGIDDDGDGVLSAAELRRHGDYIEAQIQPGVQLTDATGARPLQGLMLQLSAPNHDGTTASAQIVVLGRFALGTQRTGLRLRRSLFGKEADERLQQLTVSRGSEAQRLVLSPGHEACEVFPSAWTTVVDHAQQGLAHVLAGPDHLLFLLVVLASGWGLRRVLLSLTCFTLGHGVTLAGSALGAWSVPAAIVEPAIAATIVGMALLDQWSRRRERRGGTPVSERLRLTLVFGCALIHGLGLAGALGDLGLDTGHRLWSLLGFNLGIKLAQIGVASLVAVLLLLAATRLPAIQANAVRFASIAAVALGTVWLVQRLVTLG